MSSRIASYLLPIGSIAAGVGITLLNISHSAAAAVPDTSSIDSSDRKLLPYNFGYKLGDYELSYYNFLLKQ